MSLAQSKSRAGIVIERDTLPGMRVVAGFAARHSRPGELAGVRILVTGCARYRDTGIRHGILLFMTLHTLHGAVFSFERKFGFVVVEQKR